MNSQKSAIQNRLLQIGEVAKRSGLSIKTIRYYEDISLLTPTVKRSPSGYRLFHPQVLNRLAFIKRAQSLGLSLSETAEIFHVHDQGQLPCGEVKQHLEAKLATIAQQIAALEMLRAELEDLIWLATTPLHLVHQTICPNLQPIEDA